MAAVIRAATPADAALLLTLIRELAAYEKRSHEVVATEDDLSAALFGERPSAEAVLAELDGAPVGFALFFQTFSTFVGRPGMHLEDLYVRPAARRHGIGRALFLHVAKLAAERGCGRYEWTVLDWNAPAISFYRRQGALPLSDWTLFRLAGEALRRAAGAG
jgi:GNAT superfamily N-acetyltransferase